MFKVDFDKDIGGKVNDIGWLSWSDPNGNGQWQMISYALRRLPAGYAERSVSVSHSVYNNKLMN